VRCSMVAFFVKKAGARFFDVGRPAWSPRFLATGDTSGCAMRFAVSGGGGDLRSM